jgi:hypothetical protein
MVGGLTNTFLRSRAADDDRPRIAAMGSLSGTIFQQFMTTAFVVHRISGNLLSFWCDRSSSVSSGDIAIARLSRIMGTIFGRHLEFHADRLNECCLCFPLRHANHICVTQVTRVNFAPYFSVHTSLDQQFK